jgi:hypothetical protein
MTENGCYVIYAPGGRSLTWQKRHVLGRTDQKIAERAERGHGSCERLRLS